MKNKQFTFDDQQLLEDIMTHRRDIRGNNFLPDPLSDDSLHKIITSASRAPSVGFSQPWEFVIIRDQQVKKHIAKSFSIENKIAQRKFTDEKLSRYSELKLEGILEAPVNIAVFYKPSKMPVLGQNSMPEMGEYSVVCAIQNMWLMSRAMNIGMGWVSILNPLRVKEILNAPAENKLVAYLCFGYVKAFFSTPELERLHWEKRKDLQATTYNERF
ncbi:MAG: 5,6-dimethylbenzimidazole synthase [Cocleimonas sp.]|nr:5,6-dimethylbenzimidazole synthase [Cocleimonas sp.]